MAGSILKNKSWSGGVTYCTVVVNFLLLVLACVLVGRSVTPAALVLFPCHVARTGQAGCTRRAARATGVTEALALRL